MKKTKDYYAKRNAEIRQRYQAADHKITMEDIGDEYGLTDRRIWQIISGYDTNKRKKKGCSI